MNQATDFELAAEQELEMYHEQQRVTTQETRIDERAPPTSSPVHDTNTHIIIHGMYVLYISLQVELHTIYLLLYMST